MRTANILLSLAAACALGAGVGCNPSNDPPPPGDSDGDLGPGDGGGDGGDELPRCGGPGAGAIRVANAQTLDAMVEDPERCLLWGVDRTGNQLYVIDTAAGILQKTVVVGTRPVDLTLSPDGARLYVAVAGEQKIVAVDTASNEIVQTLVTAVAPFRIARGPDARVFYVEEAAFSAVREANFTSGLDTALTGVDFHEPDLEATADGFTLYLGEAGEAGARLVRFDAASPGLPETQRYRFDGGFTSPTPARGILLASAKGRVYFAERAFDADDLEHMRGWLGDQVVASTPDGSIVATGESIFDATTFLRFATRPHPRGGAVFSADGAWLYELDPVGSTLYRTAVATLVGTHALGSTAVQPGTLAQHRFNQLIADPVRPLLYGLDTQQNQLVFIDRTGLYATRAEIIGSMPTDMALASDGNELAIATFGATEIAIADLANETKALKQVLVVPGNPFRIAVSAAGRLAYAEQDQLSEVTLVDRATGTVLASLGGSVFQADLEFDPTGQTLFAGESAEEAAHLRRFDVSADTLLETLVSPSAFYYPARRVIYQGGHVYYAAHKLDAATLIDLGDFGEDVVYVTGDGRFAISRRHVFDAQTLLEVDGLSVDSPLVAVDEQAQVLYQFDNETGALFVQALPAL